MSRKAKSTPPPAAKSKASESTDAELDALSAELDLASAETLPAEPAPAEDEDPVLFLATVPGRVKEPLEDFPGGVFRTKAGIMLPGGRHVSVNSIVKLTSEQAGPIRAHLTRLHDHELRKLGLVK